MRDQEAPPPARTGRLTCWECIHLHYDSGMPGYSDLTPGYSPNLECLKRHWSLGDDDMQERIFDAETCADYERPLSRKD